MSKDPKRVKAGKRSRTKGQVYERHVAKRLNEAFGWELVRNLEQNRRDMHGDLVDEKTRLGPKGFTIECKNVEALSWPSIFVGGSLLKKWMVKAQEMDNTREVWLVFKSKGRDFICRGNYIFCTIKPVLIFDDYEVTLLDHFLKEEIFTA